MKVLNLTPRDYAGCAYRFTEALVGNGHEAQHITTRPHRLGYPYGLVSEDRDVIKKWLKWADVVNCWINLRPLQGLRPKPSCRFFYIGVGSEYWKKHETTHKRASEWGYMVLSGSAAMLEWGAKWFPSAIPVERWRKLKRKRKAEKPIVCQTPSNPERKNTSKIEAVLAGKTDFEFRVIKGVSHNECLKAKAVADICVGQFRTRGGKGGGYGVSSCEAWAMKIPVITISPDWIEESYIKQIGYLPYYRSEIEDLPKAIDALLSDRALYEEYADKGYEYLLKFHNYPATVKRFEELCQLYSR